MIKGKVENIKDKIDGNELDLSLSNRTEVPVKELVSVTSDYSLYNYHVYLVLFTLKKMYSFSLSLGKVWEKLKMENIDFCAGCITKGNSFGSIL